MFGVYMKLLKFLMKNLNDLYPSNLTATHRNPVKADPSKATNVDTIRELGSGNKKSSRTPTNGAAKTVEVSKFFVDVLEESSPINPVGLDSPHL